MLKFLKTSSMFSSYIFLGNVLCCHASSHHLNANFLNISLQSHLFASRSGVQLPTWLHGQVSNCQPGFYSWTFETKKSRLRSGYPFKIWTSQWMILVLIGLDSILTHFLIPSIHSHQFNTITISQGQSSYC